MVVCDRSFLFYVVHRTQQDSSQHVGVHRLGLAKHEGIAETNGDFGQ